MSAAQQRETFSPLNDSRNDPEALRMRAREVVLIDSSISRNARLLYLTLDNHQRLRGYAWPSQACLAGELGCDVRSVQRYLRELVQAKLCRHYRTKKGGPNRYVLFHSFVEKSVENSLPHDRIVGTLTTGLSVPSRQDCRDTESGNGIQEVNTDVGPSQASPVEKPESQNLPEKARPGSPVPSIPPDTPPFLSIPAETDTSSDGARVKHKPTKPVCRRCQGSGTVLLLTGASVCSICAGSGESEYRSVDAVNRRQAYLQSARSGPERDTALRLEGFVPIGNSPALQRALQPEFGATHEEVRRALVEYPRRGALKGVPDDQIVQRTLAAAGTWDALRDALRRMSSDYAAPSQSWAWFPAVVRRYCGRETKARSA
jgi:hypothetical protein